MDSSRRTFLGGAAAGMAAASYNRVLGANDRPRLALIGAGGRGMYLMGQARKELEAEFGAVCDVYDQRLDEAAAAAGPQAAKSSDYREVLGRNDIDGVIVATPDHWHAAITVDACKAGKDVYIEKPMTHHPKDGLAIVKAAREHKRIIQVGVQGRGMKQTLDARDLYVKPGIMGKVGMVRTWYQSNSGYVLTAPPGFEKKPEGLDWNRWLGPGPKVPWNPEIYFSPYKWLHYDGGMIMGIGIHVVDTAHFVLGLTRPVSAVAGGNNHYYKDGRDTPDTVALIIDYPEATVTFAAECLTAKGVKTSAGIELRGTGGVLHMERYTASQSLTYTPNATFSKAPAAVTDGSSMSAAPMLRDWVECMRTRNKPVANEESAYWSTVACFMGNQAFLTGSKVAWDDRWNLPA